MVMKQSPLSLFAVAPYRLAKRTSKPWSAHDADAGEIDALHAGLDERSKDRLMQALYDRIQGLLAEGGADAQHEHEFDVCAQFVRQTP